MLDLNDYADSTFVANEDGVVSFWWWAFRSM